jgi:hypothetical protein
MKILEKKNSIPEEDIDAPLNKYAFADLRKNVKEPDNELEKEIEEKLVNHFDAGLSIDQNTANLFQHFLTNGMYRDIFRKPKESIIYRGMSVDENYIKNALNLTSKDILPKKGDISQNFTFTPFEDVTITSWSTNIKSASVFTKKKGIKTHSLILYASSSENDNKLIDCKYGIYTLRWFVDYKHEKEVLGIGNIKVNRITWNS